MKCNKCLKQIPKGEEIRFSSHDSAFRGDGGGYSGCYCEDCWKKSKFYRSHEDGEKTSNDCSKGGIPSYAWFFIGVFAALATVWIIWWITKDKE